VGPEVYTILGALFEEKMYKITNKKLGAKLNIYNYRINQNKLHILKSQKYHRQQNS
jgi:hypothetical protein